MYELEIITSNASNQETHTALPYLKQLSETISILSKYHKNFLTLGLVDENIQDKINDIVSNSEQDDNGLSEGQVNELDKMANKGHLRFLDDPTKCYETALYYIKKLDEKYKTGLFIIRLHGKNIHHNSNLSLLISQEGKVRVKIDFPYEKGNENWFNNINLIRQLVSELAKLWVAQWLVFRPSMYFPSNPIKGMASLFHNREPFGWMAYTSKRLNKQSDTLALIEPMHQGTFMLLQSQMMTLRPEDVERVHQAEAFLTDYDILPILTK